LEKDSFAIGFSVRGPWICYAPRRERLHCVDLSGDFEGYVARWSSKTRYNIKRSLRKLQERNPESLLDIASTPDAIEAFLSEAARISATTYQSRLLKSGLGDDAGTLKAMRAAAARGEGRGYLLRDQGRAIAFAWCAGSGEYLTYETIGYLEETAALSPGSVLLYLILQDLFQDRRFTWFDFGVGDASYKQMFATHTLEFIDVFVLRATLTHHLYVRAHWYLDRFSTSIGAILERWGLKSRVKRWLRAVRRD
jgi:CelD/BcsL family acetyltransferase involved in cellulose biosynthesis